MNCQSSFLFKTCYFKKTVPWNIRLQITAQSYTSVTIEKNNRYFCKTHLATLSAAVLSIIFFDAWLCISVLNPPGCLNRNDADAVSFPEWTASNDSLFCYLVLPHTTQPLHMNNFVAGVVLAFPGRCTMSCWMLISRLKLLNCWRD